MLLVGDRLRVQPLMPYLLLLLNVVVARDPSNEGQGVNDVEESLTMARK